MSDRFRAQIRMFQSNPDRIAQQAKQDRQYRAAAFTAGALTFLSFAGWVVMLTLASQHPTDARFGDTAGILFVSTTFLGILYFIAQDQNNGPRAV